MKIAIVGCGYVADFYMRSMEYHPELQVCGAFDIDRGRLHSFCKYFSVRPYSSLDGCLDDETVELVLNLTDPRSHYEITRACIQAGKHVYSEKPLAMTYTAATELVKLAESCGVRVSSAPCSLFGESAQTMWKALRDGAIGTVRLVYGNFDSGMTPKYEPWLWMNESGAYWPARDEFEVGCTYEHAGYLLTWLGAFFGPATRVTSFAARLLPDKGIPLEVDAADFTVGCIEYPNGVVARVTNSIVAPIDRSMTIIGDEGTLYVVDVRDDAAPVYLRRTPPSRVEAGLEYRINYWRNKFERVLNKFPWNWGMKWRFVRRYPFVIEPHIRSSGHYKPVDFCRGPAEMASAIKVGRIPRLSADFSVHIVEITEALQHPVHVGGCQKIHSSFDPIPPLI